MYFVIQKIETKVEGQDTPQVQLGCCSEHTSETDANDKAEELSKTAPGTFFVTKGLSVWRPAPKKEAL